MPQKAKSPVLKMAQFMSEMTPAVKKTVMAIINKEEDHPAVKAVAFFAGLEVGEARAILDIIVAAVNERDPDYKKPGRPKAKTEVASGPEGESIEAAAQLSSAPVPVLAANPTPPPSAMPSARVAKGGKGRR